MLQRAHGTLLTVRFPVVIAPKPVRSTLPIKLACR